MSEFFPNLPEQQKELPENSHELLAEHFEKKRADAMEQITKAQNSIERLSQKAEEYAKSREEMQFLPKNPEHFIQENLSSSDQMQYDSLQRTLKQAQSELSKTEKVFSKLIHKRGVDVTSEVLGKTIVRPSGILMGGLVSFFGSLVIIFVIKKYGYQYNYLISLLLFVGGWLLGLSGEVFLNGIRKLINSIRNK